MKLEEILHTVSSSLRDQNVPAEVIRKVEDDLEVAIKEQKAERSENVKKKNKNKFVVVALDPQGLIQKSGGLTGWVVNVEEGAADQSVFDRVNRAANAYNATKKGKKQPAKNIGDAFEIPRKFWKNEDNPSEKTLVKTKSPIYILSSNGRLG
jgi:hypothetical protein